MALSRRQAVQAASADGTAVMHDADTCLVEVQRVLDDLAQRGWLSDQRAAEALIHAKAPRYGQRRLKQMLQSRSIEAGLVAALLAKTRDSELERELEVWRRRYGSAPTSLQDRARQQRFLAARGFDADVIDKVMREAARATPGAGDDAD